MPGYGYPRSRFPNSFVLSHYHADHCDGLMASPIEPRYEGSCMGLGRVFLPYTGSSRHRQLFRGGTFAMGGAGMSACRRPGPSSTEPWVRDA